MQPQPMQYSPFAKQSQYSFKQNVFLHLHTVLLPWMPEFWSNKANLEELCVVCGSELTKGESMSMAIPGDLCAVSGERLFRQN